MKKTIVIIMIMLSISILSGCISDNKINSKNVTDTNTTKNISSEVKISDGQTKTEEVSNVSKLILTVADKESDSKRSDDTDADWCKPGNKLTVKLQSGDKEFTIVGLTTYQEREVCKAEILYENGKSIKYFSKDGKFQAMDSKSESSSGNVYSEARVGINSSR